MAGSDDGRRLPDNLALLRGSFGEEALSTILPGDSFEIDGIEFVCDYRPESTAERFYIVKHPRFVQLYLEICGRFKGSNIVELGIAEGGSTVLIALTAEPRRLVAVDLEPEPLTALSELIDNRGLQESVRPFYGVDQADRAGLAAIVDAEFGDEPIDLIFDDASHQLAETRTSFETLFPRLRTGGVYAIEDWNSDHVFRDAIEEQLRTASDTERQQFQADVLAAMTSSEPQAVKRPMMDLAIELLLARASLGDAIAEVIISEYWVTIVRGPGELDPTTFRLSDISKDHFGYFG